MNLAKHIDSLVTKHGGLRAAARAVRIDPGYLSRIRDGQRVRPSEKRLRRLGLVKVVVYRRAR